MISAQGEQWMIRVDSVALNNLVSDPKFATAQEEAIMMEQVRVWKI